MIRVQQPLVFFSSPAALTAIVLTLRHRRRMRNEINAIGSRVDDWMTVGCKRVREREMGNNNNKNDDPAECYSHITIIICSIFPQNNHRWRAQTYILFFYDHHHLLAKCRAHKKWIYSFGWTFTYHVFWLLLFIVSVPSFVYDPSVRWWFFLSIRAHNAHLCSLPRNREMIKNKILWGIEKTKASRIHCASDCEFMLVEWKRCVGPCMSWHSMLTSACASITTQTQSHTQRAQPLPLATM